MKHRHFWQSARLRLRQLRDNPFFEWFVIAIIVLSSLLIGIKTYDIDPWWLHWLDRIDYAITLFFLLELVVRILAEGSMRRFFRSGWNVFDFIIVTISLIPIDESQYVLLGRILRLFRVLRLISFVPELRLLVTALLTAIPRMGYVAVLMFVIFYVYGVVGSLLFGSINPDLWGNVGVALLTLFRIATFEGWTDVMYETMAVYPWSWLYYLTFIFLSAFVFLNMMIGIVVNVLEEEHRKIERAQEAESVQLEDLQAQLAAMEARLVQMIQTRTPGRAVDEEPPSTQSRNEQGGTTP